MQGTRWLALTACALLGGCAAGGAADGPRVGIQEGVEPARRAPIHGPFSLHVVLPPVSPDERARLGEISKGRPLPIGFPRAIPAEYGGDLGSRLTWVRRDDGGATAAFAVTSPSAQALRLALHVDRVPDGAELRFFSVSGQTKVYGPFTARDMRRGQKEGADGTTERAIFWSPVVEGDTIGADIRLADFGRLTELGLRLAQVSHLPSFAR